MEYQLTILDDKSRLDEIFKLRTLAWENSVHKRVVNSSLFPEGWFDELDESGIHCVVSHSGKIIAATRLNIFHNHKDFMYGKWIKHIHLPEPIPFGYYSRMVILKEYRKRGLAQAMDTFILAWAKSRGLRWLIGFTTLRTNYLQRQLNFAVVGQTNAPYSKNAACHRVDVIIKTLDH